MTFILPLRGSLVRKVSGGPSGYTYEEPAPNGFFCNLIEGRGNVLPTESSPREGSYSKVQLPAGTIAPLHPPANPGDRVVVQGETYELIGRPRQLMSGRRILGAEVAVMSVNDLYPFQALLVEGQDMVRADIILAMWTTGANTTDRGAYALYEAEAPLDFAEDLKVNRSLTISGQRFNIAQAIQPLTSPQVKMVLRRRDG